jgi:hypothetical protein
MVHQGEVEEVGLLQCSTPYGHETRIYPNYAQKRFFAFPIYSKRHVFTVTVERHAN